MLLQRSTKSQIEKSARQLGTWQNFVAFREGLVKKGYERRVAWVIAVERFFPGMYEPGIYKPEEGREESKVVPLSVPTPPGHPGGEFDEPLPKPSDDDEHAGHGELPNLHEAILWVAENLDNTKVKKGPSRAATSMLKHYRGANPEEGKVRRKEFYQNMLLKVVGKPQIEKAAETKTDKLPGLIQQVLDGCRSALPTGAEEPGRESAVPQGTG